MDVLEFVQNPDYLEFGFQTLFCLKTRSPKTGRLTHTAVLMKEKSSFIKMGYTSLGSGFQTYGTLNFRVSENETSPDFQTHTVTV